jgi:hypothetical protein
MGVARAMAEKLHFAPSLREKSKNQMIADAYAVIQLSSIDHRTMT